MKNQKNTFQIISASLAGVILTLGIAACQVGENLPSPGGVAVNPSTAPTAAPTTTPTADPTTAPTAAPTTAPTADPGDGGVVVSPPPTAPADVAGVQIDRVGLPAVSTVLVGFNAFTSQLGLTAEAGGAAQDTYNSETPDTDAAKYSAGFSSALQTLFNRTPADADNLAQNVLTPDLLPLDVTKATGFPNGRLLADDVVDGELQLLSAVETAGDKIDANDKAFKTAFPFLAEEH